MVRLFYAFKKNFWVLFQKVAFWGDSEERVEVRESPEHQREQSRGKRGNARVCIKADDRAPQTSTTKPARKVARPGCAGWHDRARLGCASWHGCARW